MNDPYMLIQFQIRRRASQSDDSHIGLHRVGTDKRLFRGRRRQRQKMGKSSGKLSRAETRQDGREELAQQVGAAHGRAWESRIVLKGCCVLISEPKTFCYKTRGPNWTKTYSDREINSG